MRPGTLICSGLGRRLDDGRWLYQEASLQFGRGLWCVVGPNGSGKSSLLRDLISLRPAMFGGVQLGDRNLRSIAANERARLMAYLPQTQALPYDRRVRDIVMLGRAPHRSLFGMASPRDHEAVERAMRACEVSEFEARGILSLSGGERQRVMLARLLATESPTLILDEPSAALDIGHTLQTCQLLRSLADEGRCVIVAMHELDLARRFADHVVLLGSGRGNVIAGAPQEVLSAERVSEVFEVDASVVAGELRFAAKIALASQNR